MSTPLMQAAQRYLDGGFSRFHMPGHKGQALPGLGPIAHYDLTEVTGLDSLYHADGAIAEMEAAYARLYGSAGSFASAGGSTLCIQAMLAVAVPAGSRILAARGVHTAATSAFALLDLHPVWVYPDCDDLSGLAMAVTPQQIEKALKKDSSIKAVYLTSPNSFGVISDIGGISAVCKHYNVPLLVDNAHGAHLRFLKPSQHPLQLGADLCCDSLHKTMPVLTGGALLHVGNPRYLDKVKERMALFGSTSPNYLILLSMDTALEYFYNGLAADLHRVSNNLEELAGLAQEKGFYSLPCNMDPLRLTMGFGGIGYTREQFAEHLASYHIEPEYLGDGFCVLMASGMNSEEDFSRLRQLIEGAKSGEAIPCRRWNIPSLQAALSPRQAVFADSEAILVEQAAGRIASGMVTPCPPGIPIVVAGEVLCENALGLLKHSGISTVNVVKL